MTKTLVDCGNCGPDFQAIRAMVEREFGARVLQSHGLDDTLAILRENQIDLVTINRKLDQDYSDGLEVAKAIKADAEVSRVPVMLVTNYAEHQEAAIAVGCVRGFGKLALGSPETHHLLRPFLGCDTPLGD
jgi:CheY-like chemotaxis protein